MSDIERRLAAPSDSRGRVVSIFVGAVLLPSIALSVLSFNAVPKHAENLKISLKRQAEKVLYYWSRTSRPRPGPEPSRRRASWDRSACSRAGPRWCGPPCVRAVWTR